MTAADDAWEKYNDGYEQSSRRANDIPIRLGEIPQAAFLAGYRQALEDAAEMVEGLPNEHSHAISIGFHSAMALALRLRATADSETTRPTVRKN